MPQRVCPWPAALEVSDPRLRDLLEEEVAALDVEVLLGAMTAEKQRLLKDTVAAFDARESEQWEQNKKFAGVLKQRRQRGLARPGAHPKAACLVEVRVGFENSSCLFPTLNPPLTNEMFFLSNRPFSLVQPTFRSGRFLPVDIDIDMTFRAKNSADI